MKRAVFKKREVNNLNSVAGSAFSSGGEQKEPIQMDKETEFKRFFQFTSLITDVFPSRGAKILDVAVKGLLGNILVYKAVEHQARKQFRKAGKFESVLVAADLNIGDAIIAQGAIEALRQILPDARIDCVIKKSARNLIEGNPRISNLYPLYVGAPYPAEGDLIGLSRIASSHDYDLVINFSPMVDDKTFGNKNVVNYSMMAAELIRNESRQGEAMNNVVYMSYHFMREIFRDSKLPKHGGTFKGAEVYLSDEALDSARSFLEQSGISTESPIVLFNPDASAKFTRMPFEFQLNILKKLSSMNCSVLLGAGHVEKLIEHELMYSLSPGDRKNITVIPPSTDLDVYTALVDLSDVFISGDTGPLHLAAARKFSRTTGKALRNRTAVLSVFGGTPSHIYGYDSQAPGFFPANQDAPSKAFVAQSHCRNITCINKMAKTCREVRCFQKLDPADVAMEAYGYLKHSKKIVEQERMRILVK